VFVSKKIFIVDDADFMIDMLRLIVREAGHRVVGTAVNGLQALDSIENLPATSTPEVVTVDFHMPKLDGMETIRRIRALVPGVKVILISAHATIPVVMQAKDVGVDAFIAKPFEPQAVLNAIDRLG
jgi:two-component system chemotaxis response regulator CheY